MSPNGHMIRYGLVGSCDILGICRGGRFLGIEVKTGSGRLRKEQEAFRDMIQRFGGLYILARSLEDVKKCLQEQLLDKIAHKILSPKDSSREP